MSEVYTVTIRTACRACAMALAGHAPRLIKEHSVFVQPHDSEERPGALYIHTNTGGMYAHDGSDFICPEHGGASDLRRNPSAKEAGHG